MLNNPYLPWPLFRRSVVAAFQRSLTSVDDVRAGQQRSEPYFDRDQQERDQDERIIDAALALDERKSTSQKRAARPLCPEQQAVKDFGRDRPAPPGAPFAARPEPTASKPPVARGINRLQDAQLGEWGAFYDRNQRDRDTLEATIESQYGQSERLLRRGTFEREQKFAKAGWLRRWFLKNFTHQSEALANDRRTLADLQQRTREMRDGLERQIREERRALEDRHAQERQALNPLRRSDPQANARETLTQQHGAATRQAQEPGATVIDTLVFNPADPLAASIQAQQQAQGAAFLGAALPGYVASTHDASQPHPADYAALRAAYMDRAAAAREAMQQQEEGPAPGESE